MGRRRDIEMREIRVNDHPTCRGVIEHAPDEAITFDVRATPAGSDRTTDLSFRNRAIP